MCCLKRKYFVFRHLTPLIDMIMACSGELTRLSICANDLYVQLCIGSLQPLQTFQVAGIDTIVILGYNGHDCL